MSGKELSAGDVSSCIEHQPDDRPTASDERFERLLRDADRRVRAVVFRMVGTDVDDVLQVAYVKAYRGWSSFEGRSLPSTWLHSIAVNAALDHLRARGRAADHRAGMSPADGQVDDPAERVASAIDLDAALQQLPVDRRVVVLLVDGQGFSHTDAAVVLGVPAGTVASRLSRARHELPGLLEGERHGR